VDLIAATGLSKRYRRTWALRDVTLTIPEGGVTALVGPNGAGKSTLLKLCIGFERATAGAIEVLGVDPARDRAAAVARVGYVPQSPSLHRDLSVLDHLRLADSIRPYFDLPHARDRLDALGIALDARLGELSGGQQSQVSLAIALGTRASLLLLDEPLANLDPLARREFLQVVTEAVRDGGISAILSSHVISDVEPVCDRLLVLGDGRVLLHDTVAAALAAHRVVDAQEGLGPRPAGGDVRGVITPGSPGSLVALFPDRHGALHQLLRADGGAPATASGAGREPTLEEVVMGYLSSARPASRAAA
jgi:ABC-2 type transport system ATP-binding protein